MFFSWVSTFSDKRFPHNRLNLCHLRLIILPNANTPNDLIIGGLDDSRGEIEMPVVREAKIGARSVMETVASVWFLTSSPRSSARIPPLRVRLPAIIVPIQSNHTHLRSVHIALAFVCVVHGGGELVHHPRCNSILQYSVNNASVTLS